MGKANSGYYIKQSNDITVRSVLIKILNQELLNYPCEIPSWLNISILHELSKLNINTYFALFDLFIMRNERFDRKNKIPK